MNDYYRVPTLALLSILVAVFVALYLRSRTQRRFLWLMGWSFAVIRVSMQIIPFGKHGIGLAISYAALELAALMFLGSMSPLYYEGRVKVSYVTAFATLLILFSVQISLDPFPGPMMRVVIFLTALATVCVATLWSTQKNLLPVPFTVFFTLLSGGVSLYFVSIGNYDRVMELTHSGMCFMTALLVLATYRRFSPGVIFTAAGLLMWSSPILTEFFPIQNATWNIIDLRALNLMKVMTAVGMIVLVLEDEITLNEASQTRDRRARAEMEQYSQLDVSEVPNRDFGIQYERVCATITSASRFAQAAIFLRTVEQHFQLVGSAGMDPSLVAALDAMGRRMVPKKVEAFGKGGHVNVRLGNTRVVDLRSLVEPGGELEQLQFLRPHVILMKTPAEALQGVLVLSGLRSPAESLVAEDLLPLELLVARLVAAHENNVLLRRVVQSEKMAGLGQLTGGVAHELNNPLTVVMGYAELIVEGDADETTRRNAAVILSESQRMKQTIESLARFWKSSPDELTPVSVEQMLKDIEQLRKPEFERAGIELEITIARNLPTIQANGDQMRQVLLQILNNAAAALQNTPAEQEKRVRIDATLAGQRLQVLIRDTGPGFPNPHRVFDPFFTTKEPGEGPGLGLSLCYSIIREHGGEIFVFNLQPHGAAVAVEMPVNFVPVEAAIADSLSSN
jgi:two-component system, NtrC family, sensor kinase